LKPTNLVLVVATPEEILSRRTNDQTRTRDEATKQSLEEELNAATVLLYASSIFIGCPSLKVENPDGGLENAAQRVLRALT
jgi:adenylate kinase